MYFSPNKYMAEIRSLRKELEEAQKKWRDGKLNKNASILDLFEPPEEGKELVLNEKRFEDECYLRGFFACVSSTDGSVRISVSGEVIPGAAQRGCPLYLRCSMPDLMR